LWITKSCCSWVFTEMWTTCNTHHLYYQSTIRGVKKWTCLVLIGTARLDHDASCNENGPNLSSVPTYLKCNKLVTMQAQTFIDSGALKCFMDKELVWQYKLVLMEKNTLMLVEIVDGWSFSSKLITHETKPLDVTIGSHTIKVVFNAISFPRNHVINGLSWLVLHNPRVD